jgi:pimeloyl-ACP methyl ester carboxylesterase
VFSKSSPSPLSAANLVVALSCSGADGKQWRGLREVLGPDYELTTPEHYGSGASAAWRGGHVFTLSHDAERTLALLDGADRQVHLCGHSYGGGVALHIALRRPGRIASLALYEPSAFHLLKESGGDGRKAFAEIAAIARQTRESISVGDHRSAASVFVDYWAGTGAFGALLSRQQQALTDWVSKAPLDFAALMDERTPACAYDNLGFPVLVLRGQHAPTPTRMVADILTTLVPDARLGVIAGAGHMGPFTHGGEVNKLFKAHFDAARLKAQRLHSRGADHTVH